MQIKFEHRSSVAKIVNNPVIVRADGSHLKKIAELGRKARELLELELPEEATILSNRASILIRPYRKGEPPHMQAKVR